MNLQKQIEHINRTIKQLELYKYELIKSQGEEQISLDSCSLSGNIDISGMTLIDLSGMTLEDIDFDSKSMNFLPAVDLKSIDLTGFTLTEDLPDQ